MGPQRGQEEILHEIICVFTYGNWERFARATNAVYGRVLIFPSAPRLRGFDGRDDARKSRFDSTRLDSAFWTTNKRKKKLKVFRLR